MENIENLVEQTENVETATEETAEKTFTQADVDRMVKEKLDEVMPGKIARREAKIRKEMDREYGELVDVLRAGTGKESVGEIKDTLKQFYGKKGVDVPSRPEFTDQDIEYLARKDADDIISSGFDDVVYEVDRLAAKGADRMTPRERALFKTLAEHRKSTERGNELSQIGVTEDVYNSKEFKEFAADFNSNTPIRKIYELYAKTTQPKKEIQTMGSMKQNVQNNGLKDYYTPDEIASLTEEDLADPQVWANVRRSMTERK